MRFEILTVLALSAVGLAAPSIEARAKCSPLIKGTCPAGESCELTDVGGVLHYFKCQPKKGARDLEARQVCGPLTFGDCPAGQKCGIITKDEVLHYFGCV